MSDENPQELLKDAEPSDEVTVEGKGITEPQTGWEYTADYEATSPTPPSSTGGAKPFESEEAMEKALDDARMRYDPEYRHAVEARVAASMVSEAPGQARFSGDPNKSNKDLLDSMAAREKARDPMNEAKIRASRGATAGPEPFSSDDELVEAMSDDRYNSDPAYRQYVDARVAVSNLI